MAVDAGLGTVQAASLISAFSTGLLGGILLVAYIGDRVNRVVLLSGMYALLGAMITALLISQSFLLLLAVCAGLGLSGSTTPVYQALIADRFGPASFGTVRGLMVPIMALMAAVGMRFSGEIFDRTGGYDLMLYIFIVVQLCASMLIYSTRLFGRSTASETGN